MTSYVAFLRGIGPGDPRKSNESLREIFISLGFTDVQSFISSGNIIFKSEEENLPLLENRVEQAFRRAHGIEVATFIRTKKSLVAFLAREHFGQLKHSQQTYLLVTFIKKGALNEKTEISKLQGGGFFGVDKRFNVLCSAIDTTGVKTPDFMIKLEKVLGKNITSRTINTLERIAQRV